MSFNPETVREISVQELKRMKDAGEKFQLIDVREKNEYDIANLNGLLIPLSEIGKNADKIQKEGNVIVHCRSGKRSSSAILELQKKHGFHNLFNLKGGILAWADEIDPSMPRG